MEYNLDSVAPPPKSNPLKRFWNFVASAQYSRTLGILFLLLIAAAIPLTAYFAQQQTRSRQQAAALSCKAEFTPLELGTNVNANMSMEEQNKVYQWVSVNNKANGGQSNPTCSDQGACSDGVTHSECPKNESSGFVNKDTSNWCYNSRCLQLRYIGPPAGPTITPPFTTTPTGTCTAWNNADATPKCTKPGGTACTDYGSSSYCNWNVSAYQACQQTCTIAPTGQANQCEEKLYTVSGRVITSSGGGVSNATVCLDPVGSCANAAKKATTNSGGNYTIANVTPGGNGHNVYLDPGTIPSGATISSPNPQIINGGTCEDVSVSYRITTGTPGDPTPTPTPTGPAGATATPTPSVTPQPGQSKVTITLALAGIGQRGSTGTPQAKNNPNPIKTKRDVTIYLYEPGADTSSDVDGQRARFKPSRTEAIEYDGSGKFVVRDFDLGQNFVPGDYQVFVKTPGYLRKRIPGVQTINAGTNTITQQVTLALGDANNDNSLNINDYQAYLSCLGRQTADCVAKADFNDDGKVDIVTPVPDFSDHALFTSQFAIIEGD